MVKYLPYRCRTEKGLPRHFECVSCGFRFRHWINAVRHENKCFRNLKIPRGFFKSLKMRIEAGIEQVHDVTCGNSCGHFDYLNQCCWLSWHNKEEEDYCNYGLVEVEGVIYTPKEFEALMEDEEE